MKYYSLLFLFSLSVCFPSYSQNFSSFKKFPIENPLSYKSVRTITQDEEGFMWFGSHDGLHRFDGYQFKVYRNNSDKLDSLSNNNIYPLLKTATKPYGSEPKGG